MTRALLSLFARALLVACVILAVLEGAGAHDVLANGQPVPAWIKSACCGPQDFHILTPDQVHETSGGWRIDGYRELIPYGKELPSEDGTYAIFYMDYADGSQSRAFCFFVPPRSF